MLDKNLLKPKMHSLTNVTVAIDLIVQHIRDFLNNRSSHGSTTDIAMYMHLDAETAAGCAASVGDTDTYAAIRRFSTLCKELTMQSNLFFENNQNLTSH